MNLEDVMVREVIAVSPEETVLNAAQTMRRHSVGCVPITVGRAVKGIITDRDLLGCMVASHDPSACKVSSHMSRPVIVLAPGEELRVAADVMRKKRIKRIPIVEEGKLVGLISFSDINRIARDQARLLLLEFRWIADLIEEPALQRLRPIDHGTAAA